MYLAGTAMTSFAGTYFIGVLSRKNAPKDSDGTSNGNVDTSANERPYDEITNPPEPQYGTIMPMLPIHRENENDDNTTQKPGVIYQELTAIPK